MTITKEQIKDIGWALSIARGFQPGSKRLASAEAGLKALIMKPTGIAPYTPMQRAELLISQLPATHEGRNTWLKEYGEGLRMPWLSCSDTTAEVERAAPKAYADACSDRGQQTARNEHGIGERGRHEPVQPLSFEDDIKSKDW